MNASCVHLWALVQWKRTDIITASLGVFPAEVFPAGVFRADIPAGVFPEMTYPSRGVAGGEYSRQSICRNQVKKATVFNFVWDALFQAKLA